MENNRETAAILNSMISFIRSHCHERIAMINKQADDEFTIEKENFIAQEKERIEKEYVEKLKKDEINLRIARSKQDNAQRIENMKETNKLVQKLYKEARLSIIKRQ
jgi:hypothetical protein